MPAEKVALPHQPEQFLVVHLPPLVPELMGDTAVTVAGKLKYDEILKNDSSWAASNFGSIVSTYIPCIWKTSLGCARCGGFLFVKLIHHIIDRPGFIEVAGFHWLKRSFTER